MSDWSVPLGDVVTLCRGASYKSARLDEPGPVLLGLGTIGRNGGFKGDGLRTYGGDTPPRILLGPGDLYVSLKDMTHKAELLGAVARVPEAIEHARLTQDTIRLDVHGDVDRAYLYWSLQTPEYRSYCRARGTGTTNLDLSPSDFLAFKIWKPSLPEQRAIAEVLGALDDKIAANREVLSGTDGLVRARYDQLMASAVKTRELRDVATNPRRTVAPEEVDPSGLYVGLEHIPRRQMWLGAVGTAAEVTSAKSVFQESDVLFGKLRPYFHKVVAAPGAGICSTDVLVVRAVEREMSGLVLAACSSDAAIAAATSAADGTRMPRAKWKDIAGLSVPAPDSSEARSFSAEVEEFACQAAALRVENEKLANTRDGLLQLLMSGKLRVKDAEKQVGEVG